MDEFKNIVRFYGRCFGRARLDTLAFFGHTWRGVLKFLFPTALYLLLLERIAAPSERAEMLFHLKTVAASTVASLLCGSAVFLLNLIAAPYRVRMDGFVDQSFQLLFGPGGSYVQPQQYGTLYRVGVRNATADPIQHVTVEVTNIQPNPPPFLPVRLHIMHDNPPPGGQFQNSFKLDADQTEFIDVVDIVNRQGAPQFLLKHIIPNLQPHNLLGPASELTIRARGQNHPPESRTFAIMNVGGVFTLVSI
jgi:hypothetical protein